MSRHLARGLLGSLVAVLVTIGSSAVAFAQGPAAPPAAPSNAAIPKDTSSGAATPKGTPSPSVTVVVAPAAAAVGTTPSAARGPSSPGQAQAGTVAKDPPDPPALPPIAVDPRLNAPQPPPGTGIRTGSGFAATPGGSQAVLYGGGDVFGNGASLGDTWVWDGTTWTPECGTTTPGATSRCAPGPRDLVGEATGPTGVVLYGGRTVDSSGNQSGPLADGYIWDGNAWQLLCAPCAPGARTAPAMAGNGTVVLLFGGGDLGGNNGQAVPLGDTWQFDGVNWTEVDPGGPGQPAPRFGAAMAWDGVHFVLFGGLVAGSNGNPVPLGDTWIWTGSDWVQACGEPLAACGPDPRILGGFAYLASPDPDRRGALLVGGLAFPNGTNNGNPDILGDIWFWNGSTWIQQASPWPASSPIGNDPPPLGLPVVGALASLPGSCAVTLTGDFAEDTASGPVPAPGTWNIGFDANGDGKPDPCPSTAAATSTTLGVSTILGAPRSVLAPGAAAAEPSRAALLPRTGSPLATFAFGGTGLVLVGLAIFTVSRRSSPRDGSVVGH